MPNPLPMRVLRLAALSAVVSAIVGLSAAGHAQDGAVLRGAAAFGSWREDAPGKRRHITADVLPAPYATP